MSGEVTGRVEGGVLIITIDQPATRNAMTAAMARTLASLIDRLDDSSELAAAVLHGAGGTFCSGMDLKAFRVSGERPVDPRRGSGGLARRPPAAPLVAAVEGHALGLGLELVLACDLVVAADDARLGLPEVRHGLVAAGGGAMRLPERLPRAAAMEMLLTGRPASAMRLHQFGLVNRLVSPGLALHSALELAHEIGDLPTDAVQLTKQIATQSRDWPAAEMFERQEPGLSALLARRRREHEATTP